MLAVAAAHWPLGVLARNYWQLVHPWRVALIIASSIVLSCMAAYVLTRMGVARQVAVFTVLIATVVFTRGGPLFDGFHGLVGWLVLASLPVAAYLLARRMRGDPAIDVVSPVLVVALASGPVIVGYDAVSTTGESLVETVNFSPVDLVEKPDVFLVVLDGYPGLQAIGQELGVNKDELVSDLAGKGFEVPPSAWSAYGTTELAVPSILNMSYPLIGQEINNGTRQELHRIIGGDNSLLSTLERNGYESVMIEAGWAGSECGPEFDRCIDSPWLDDLAFISLWEGVVGRQLVKTTGHAYTVASRASMTAVERLIDEEADQPRFVFAHVIAPHPPFFLDPDCATEVTAERLGDSFLREGVDRSLREDLFLGQVACVDSFMTDVAAAADPDDVVVFVADHGTDRRKHLLDQGVADARALVERMNVFVAARLPADCQLPGELLTVNLMRLVLSCYTHSPIELLSPRMFLPGQLEVTRAEIERLMSGS